MLLPWLWGLCLSVLQAGTSEKCKETTGTYNFSISPHLTAEAPFKKIRKELALLLKSAVLRSWRRWLSLDEATAPRHLSQAGSKAGTGPLKICVTTSSSAIFLDETRKEILFYRVWELNIPWTSGEREVRLSTCVKRYLPLLTREQHLPIYQALIPEPPKLRDVSLESITDWCHHYSEK